MPILHEIADEEARYRHGWPDDQAQPAAMPPALHRAGADPAIVAMGRMQFIGFDNRSGVPVAAIVIHRPDDGGHHIGGTVARHHRQLGYGREALNLVCALAHHHLGIATLVAGSDASHEASCRWLASCDFVAVPETARHVLPNGRVVEARWWHHRGGKGQRRCRTMPPT